jgi:hypothetical protein
LTVKVAFGAELIMKSLAKRKTKATFFAMPFEKLFLLGYFKG